MSNFAGQTFRFAQGKALAVPILVVCLTAFSISAQPERQFTGKGSGVVSGTVYDSERQEPIEYANVVLYQQRDSSKAVTGTVTNARGRFVISDVPPGRFYLEVSFMGYRTKRVKDIQLAPDARIDLGRINLEPAVISMPGVEATAEKPKLEYRIDKKVINVAQDPSLQSGTAVDALEQAPAVKVDVDGNVSLRGLLGFTVLIDGRPSPLEGSEALQQIPASTIDRIEIVTNPSVKYDPEGKAGIINVILRKQRQSGISGILNLNGGNYGQIAGNLLLSGKTSIGTFYIGPNLNRGGFPGTREMEGWTITQSGDTSYRQSRGDMLFRMQFYGVRGGADFQLTPQDWLGIGGRIGGSEGNRSQNAIYQEWKNSPGETLSYKGSTGSVGSGTQYSVNLDASHNFGKKGHELVFKADLLGNSHQDSTQTEDSVAGVISGGKRTIDYRYGKRLNLKVDYTLPLREKDRFEAGYETRLRFGPEQESRLANFDTTAGVYISDTLYSSISSQADYVHAQYLTYTGNYKGLGAMAGLRSEYNTRKVKINYQDTTPVKRWDLFPSLHLSYSFPNQQQVMASYTRRIDRPRGWDLAPFITWMDAKNVRQGDPNLKPEYIDSYEAGMVLPFGKHRLTLDGYYRQTHNVIQRLQGIYQGDIILHTVRNVGQDQALGIEVSLDLTPLRFWDISLNGDIYDYRLKGIVGDKEIAQKSFNWNSGLTTDFTFPTGTRIQIQGRYEAPTVTAQGKEGARLSTGLAARQVLFNRQLVINLSLRDIFASSAFENESQGEGFYSHSRFSRRGLMFSLGLTWNFNNYKQERRRNNGENSDEESAPVYEY
ncbi:MAG: TonB-dependent receptor domain-containing protein [bacterium]